jgi:hypothetical protein
VCACMRARLRACACVRRRGIGGGCHLEALGSHKQKARAFSVSLVSCLCVACVWHEEVGGGRVTLERRLPYYWRVTLLPPICPCAYSTAPCGKDTLNPKTQP